MKLNSGIGFAYCFSSTSTLDFDYTYYLQLQLLPTTTTPPHLRLRLIPTSNHFKRLGTIYLTSSPAPQHHLECLSVRGQYRPNRTPGTKRGVGAHVRTSRQSRDCLRVRPFRAPPLFVAVRSASGSVLPTHARARLASLVASPLCAAPCGPFGVRFAQAT